jgi:integrase
MKRATVSEVNHPRYSHRVRYAGPGGKPAQAWFRNKTEANAFAKERNKETGQEGATFGSLATEEKSVISFWRAFTTECIDAPPPPLSEVVRQFADRWRATRTSVTVREAFDKFIASKGAEGLRPMSVDGLRSRCGRFADDFTDRPICTLTTSDVSDWLLNLTDTRQKIEEKEAPRPVALLTKKNYRRDISTLFSFAKARGWIESNPVDLAPKVRPPKQRPGVLTPTNTEKFFSSLQRLAPALQPFWALRFFAGIREQEVLRMDWAMIDMKAGEVHLPDTVTKTGHDRTVAILPALKAMLEPFAGSCGPICAASSMARRHALEKVEKDSGIRLPKNAARHSFATYHLMAFRHAGETSIQLGHGGSPDMLHRHYKGLATEKDAKAYWKIRPAQEAKNVVSIKGKRGVA